MRFDECMNFALEGASEVDTRSGKRTDVGLMLPMGDAITLLQAAGCLFNLDDGEVLIKNSRLLFIHIHSST